MTLHSATTRLFSSFLLLYSFFLVIPTAVSAWFNKGPLIETSSEPWAFFAPLILVFVLGLLLRLFSGTDYSSIQITARSGFLIVTLFWVLAAGIGCLPFLIGIKDISFTDAYFEAMSGFTTTGATIMPDVEILGPGLVLWRSMTQWIGGMGIIILFVAVLPTFGVSGYNLFRAEIPGGATVEKIKPRIAETAKSLWKVYILLTGFECFSLWGAGMPFFDAVCHSLTTMPTGGFSIKNQGIAAYDNAFIEIIIIFFMFIAGTSFSLHYRLFHRENTYFSNTEFKSYLLILSLFSFAVFCMLLFDNRQGLSMDASLRQSLFQVVSIGTTTGFATADYSIWPVPSQLLLVVLMFIGGCTGSTGGSVKVLRHAVSVKVAVRALYLAVNPRDIVPAKINGNKIDNEIIINIFSFIVFFITVFITGTVCLAMTGMDMVSSLGGAAAAIGNVGPGLGVAGPASTYATMTFFAKWVLIVLMLLGRLELFTVLALILPLLRIIKIRHL